MAEPLRTKPTYNMAQNTGYMIGQAWHCHKSVLGVCLALAVLHVAVSLTELYLAPLVLGKVESAAPLGELFSTIGMMAGTLALLRGMQAYVGENTMYGRVKVRMNLILQVTMKSVTTSYPNVGKPDLDIFLRKTRLFKNFRWKSFSPCGGGSPAISRLRSAITQAGYSITVSTLTV